MMEEWNGWMDDAQLDRWKQWTNELLIWPSRLVSFITTHTHTHTNVLVEATFVGFFLLISSRSNPTQIYYCASTKAKSRNVNSFQFIISSA
jgi:hypothetical protein